MKKSERFKAQIAKHAGAEEIAPNPKADYRRMTVTVPPDVHRKVMRLTTERKLEKVEEASASGIVREALEMYFKKNKYDL